VIDWRPVFESLIQDKSDKSRKVSRFINTLANIVAEISGRYGLKVGLTGGVFQNKPLTEKVLSLLGSKAITHSKVPPNDGGLSLGQAVFRNF